MNINSQCHNQYFLDNDETMHYAYTIFPVAPKAGSSISVVEKTSPSTFEIEFSSRKLTCKSPNNDRWN